MTATNHALTGALIGGIVGNPLLAIAAAFTSHFICDALPHYGAGKGDARYFRSSGFKTMLFIDATLCVLLVAVLAYVQPAGWLLMALCAFLATSPDLLWLPRFVRAQAGGDASVGEHPVLQFASKIQWFERPIGGFVEVAWLMGAVMLLVAYL